MKAWSSGPSSFDTTWEKLLFVHSPSEDANFYLTKKPINPKAELKALIETLSNPDLKIGPLNEHPICYFPMRMKWITKNLGTTTNIKCPELSQWKKSISTKTISIVFSSAYVDNPSSMFGHTLIKFNKHPINIPHLNSLNYVGAYSAAVDTEDPGFLYAIKGIFGGYVGSFSLSPYYMKLREYVRAESRELWEYELSLSERELDDLLDLYWEVYVAGKFDYYFLDENCSMLLARLLDIIVPEMKLIEDYKLFVVPSEFIKKIAKSDRLKSVEVTPSYRRVFFGHYNLLNNEQRKELKLAIEDHQIEDLDPIVLRTLSEYYAYKKNDLEGKVDSKHKQQEFEVRKKLSTLNLKDLPPPKPSPAQNRPDLAHDQFLIGAGIYRAQNQTGAYLKTRFGFHDLFDYDIGNEPITDIRLLDTRLNLSEDKAQFQSIGLVEMTSLPDYSYIDSRTSWKAKTAFVQDNGHLTPYAEFALGLTARGNGPLLGFLIGAETYFDRHNPLVYIPFIFKTEMFSLGIESTPIYNTKSNEFELKEKLTIRKHFFKNLSLEIESEILVKSKTDYNVLMGIRSYF